MGLETIVKYLIIFALVLGVLTLISNLIPFSVTTQLNSSIILMLGYINNLSAVINVDTIFTCIKLLANFLIAEMLFLTIRTIYRMTHH